MNKRYNRISYVVIQLGYKTSHGKSCILSEEQFSCVRSSGSESQGQVLHRSAMLNRSVRLAPRRCARYRCGNRERQRIQDSLKSRHFWHGQTSMRAHHPGGGWSRHPPGWFKIFVRMSVRRKQSHMTAHPRSKVDTAISRSRSPVLFPPGLSTCPHGARGRLRCNTKESTDLRFRVLRSSQSKKIVFWIVPSRA